MDEEYHHVHNPDWVAVLRRIGGGSHPFPNAFTILQEMESAEKGESALGESRRVPASFHKFLHILWREIFLNRGPKKAHWTADFYMDQFHMRPDDAAKWAVALQNSRLFKLRKVRLAKSIPKSPSPFFSTTPNAL